MGRCNLGCMVELQQKCRLGAVNDRLPEREGGGDEALKHVLLNQNTRP